MKSGSRPTVSPLRILISLLCLNSCLWHPHLQRLDAADLIWIGPAEVVPYPTGAGAYYSITNPFSWNTLTLPTSADRLIFQSTGAYGVAVNGGTSNQWLISNGAVQLSQSTDYTILSNSTSAATPSLDVSQAGTTGTGASLWIDDNLNDKFTNNGSAFIGNQAGSAGTIYVGSPFSTGGARWNNGGELYVGNAGIGTLILNGGSAVTNTNGHIGFAAGSSGSVTIAAEGGSWANSGTLNIGYGGTGTLRVEAGALVSAAAGYLGRSANSSGTATITGKTLPFGNTPSRLQITNTFVVGDLGTGTLNLEAAGFASSLNGSLGNSLGGTGTVNVNGRTGDVVSRWSNGSTLEIGRLGTGTLNISAEGIVSSSTVAVASLSGSNGTVAVTGAGSILTASNLFVGGNLSAVGGTGSLTVSDSGSVFLTSSLKLWNSGTLTLNSGSVTSRAFDRSVGTFTFNGGTLTVNGGAYTHSASTTSATNVLHLNGSSASDNPTLKLMGSAAVSGVEAVVIGSTNKGALEVSGGRVLNNTGTSFFLSLISGVSVRRGEGYLGLTTGSTGTALVTGSGSQWNNSSDLLVGRFGSGTLRVEAAGLITNINGVVGQRSGSVGTATITGAGSRWNNSSDLSIASEGTGTLNVAAGGTVTSMNGTIGGSSGSTGTATINGIGSRWDMSSRIYVGYLGTGTLNVEAGGVVANMDAIVGYFDGANGTVTVTGAGSQWTNNESLNIGGDGGLPGGTGLLTVSNGGAISVAQSLKLWSNATLTLNSGSVTTRNFDPSLGIFNFNGGTMTVNGGGYTHSVATGTAANILRLNGATSTDNPTLKLIGDAGNSGVQAVVVGTTNKGTLEISGGRGLYNNTTGAALATISLVSIVPGNGYLGLAAGSSGTATVTGSGSLWINSGDVRVGIAGNGTLNITAGGLVTSTFGYLGDTGGQGATVLNGTGSQWDLSTALNVGYRNIGTLNIEAGAIVTAPTTYLGTFSGANGTATVTGSGSRMNTTSFVFVGSGGTGTLNIEAGGRVASATGVVAQSAGSNGTATVTGAGSQLNLQTLYIGGFSIAGGTGLLTVADGGAVSVGSTLKLWNSGTLTLNAGSVTARAFDRSVGTFNFNGGTLTVNGGAYTHSAATGTAANILQLNGATAADNPTLKLIGNAAATGVEAVVVGSTRKATLEISGGRVFGVTGSGVTPLTLISGTNIYPGRGYIGLVAGSNGTVLVTGTGSQWNLTQELQVGANGTGTLNIQAGGIVAGTDAYVGSGSGSTGTALVTGSGSRWNLSFLSVAAVGTGTLNIEAGGVVSNTTTNLGIGVGSGTATVTGAGSQWNHTDSLLIGSSGTGTLKIEAGGLVSSPRVHIGPAGGNGTALVTGAGSQWTAGNFYIGGSTTSAGGPGLLTVSDGAAVSVGGMLKLWNQGTLTLNSGSVTTTFFDRNLGTVNFNAGTLTVNSTYTHSNASDTAANILQLNGATAADNPTLKLVGSATNTGVYAVVAGNTTKGTLEISGGRTLTLSASIPILGTVSGTSIVSGQGYLGMVAGSEGTALITGTGSRWALPSNLFVGHSGTGTLNVAAGGVVAGATSYLGFNTGSSGTATVTGTGSQWNVGNELRVGNNGTGTLNIESGGVASSPLGYVGYSSGSNGTATITGTGSRWNISSQLYIGGSSSAAGGTGSLTVTSGGTVAATSNARVWAPGTLNLQTGGAFSASQLQLQGGTFNYSGGTLTAPVVLNTGTAKINIVGSGVALTLNNMTGVGGFTKGGAGTLILRGSANSFAGGATISAGRLLLFDGSALTGSGSVTVGAGGKLTGQGTIAGALTLNAETTTGAGDGGRIAPGTDGATDEGIGTLTAQGNVTLGVGSTFEFEFRSGLHASDGAALHTTYAGTEWDLLTTAGSLTFSGAVRLQVFSMTSNALRGVNDPTPIAPLAAFDKNADPANSMRWLFAHADAGLNYTGDIRDYFIVDATQPDGLYGAPTSPYAGSFYVTASGNDVYLNYAAVPEPSSLILSGLAAAALAWRRRKRRQANKEAGTFHVP